MKASSLFLAAALMVVSAPGFAERWLLLSENEVYRLSVDADSLKPQAAAVAFRYLLAHPVAYENSITGKKYKAVRVDALADCGGRTITYLAIESYSSETGNLVGRMSIPQAERKPETFVAGGTAETLWNYVCRTSKPRKR